MMILAGIMMASCQEYEIDSQPSLPTTVKIDALDEYSIAATSPSRIVFNISSNTPWSIETDSQWCIPTPAMSAASSLVSEIVITPEDNDTYESRTAVITVSSDELGLIKTIKVIQAEKKDEPVVIIEDPVDPVAEMGLVFAENASYTVIPSTGYIKVNFTKGEMFRTDYAIRKGRTIIELAEMNMTARCNLGFNFTAESSANYKLHMEDTYWFRCAGGFGWVAPIKKAYTFDEVNAFRKLEFVVEDDPAAAGKLQISIFINDVLYGSQTGRTDVFAAGDPGCFFIFETGMDPAPGDYCVIKSITYISE